jgi:hypothetical protein
MELLLKLWAIVFPPSVSGAVAGIEKAVSNLATVEAHHAAAKLKQDTKAVAAAAKAALHNAEAEAAAKVKANIKALLGKV